MNREVSMPVPDRHPERSAPRVHRSDTGTHQIVDVEQQQQQLLQLQYQMQQLALSQHYLQEQQLSQTKLPYQSQQRGSQVNQSQQLQFQQQQLLQQLQQQANPGGQSSNFSFGPTSKQNSLQNSLPNHRRQNSHTVQMLQHLQSVDIHTLKRERNIQRNWRDQAKPVETNQGFPASSPMTEFSRLAPVIVTNSDLPPSPHPSGAVAWMAIPLDKVDDCQQLLQGSGSFTIPTTDSGDQSPGPGMGTRCNHVEHWKRLRAKRGFSYFVCHLCGSKWRTPNSTRTQTASGDRQFDANPSPSDEPAIVTSASAPAMVRTINDIIANGGLDVRRDSQQSFLSSSSQGFTPSARSGSVYSVDWSRRLSAVAASSTCSSNPDEWNRRSSGAYEGLPPANSTTSTLGYLSVGTTSGADLAGNFNNTKLHSPSGRSMGSHSTVAHSPMSGKRCSPMLSTGSIFDIFIGSFENQAQNADPSESERSPPLHHTHEAEAEESLERTTTDDIRAMNGLIPSELLE